MNPFFKQPPPYNFPSVFIGGKVVRPPSLHPQGQDTVYMLVYVRFRLE